MSTRATMLRVTAPLAVACLALLAACSQEASNPVVPTVQLDLIAGAAHGGRPLSTDLTQEVTSEPVWAGDPDGIGSALITLNHGQREVCWEVEVSNVMLPATASHIHRAPPGIRGPIVVSLSPPGASGEAAGCATGVDRALILDILTNPKSYYVNVHTEDFTAGAVRGQLPRS